MSSILQWNCRGLASNRDSLEYLMSQHNPSVIALQETQTLDHRVYNFKNFKSFTNLNYNTAAGGTALLINRNTLHSELPLNTTIEAVAARVSLHRTITICNIYLPPSRDVSKQEIEDLLEQLPAPILLLGDFNAHSPIWGGDRTTPRGRSLEEIFNERNLFILNDDQTTYLHPATGTRSVLDLSVCDPIVALDFKQQVLMDTHGSDHYPIVIETVGNQEEAPPERWLLTKADWDAFSQECRACITEESILTQTNPLTQFQETLVTIANKHIPKSKGKGTRVRVPWFNDTCKQARMERRRLLRRFRSEPNIVNKIAYNKAKAQAKRIFKKAKKDSWRQYVSGLNSGTPATKVWKAMRKIKGKGNSAPVHHLNVNGQLVTDGKEIADNLADSIQKCSSEQNYSAEFKRTKRREESTILDFSSDNQEEYNLPFSFHEMKQALSKTGDTATGIDNIHYQFFKHMPDSCLNVLLSIFNDIWETGIFPPSWREALVIPIPKPGKDHSNPTNYRPIALTSCTCKVLEKMINVRLMWHLEKNRLLSDEQCGFRKGRSTVDHLVRFDTYIREAFARRQHVVAVFFDLEKAYDTTWKYGIMKDLHGMGFRGRLPVFIEGFLADRQFRVRAGSVFSDLFEQEMGVPQGSILSPALFSIKINDIVKSVFQGNESSLFVDDFALCVRNNSFDGAVRQIQNCIYKIESWVDKNGFKCSPTKTVCMHFRKYGYIESPTLKLHGQDIRVVEQTRFLGLVLDQRLTYKAHIQELKVQCSKALNILRVLAHTDWGADRTVLLRLYRALVRSKLDYGCVVYGGACPSSLKMLDPIHHQGLRLCLGAMRTSPVPSLYAEAGEPSLELRRLRLSVNYGIKLRAMPENPAYKAVFKEPDEHTFPEKHLPPFRHRVLPRLRAAEVKLEEVKTERLTNEAPWVHRYPEVNLELAQLKKGATNSEVYKAELYQVLPKYREYTKIYTDGSKTSEGVGSAAVFPGENGEWNGDERRMPKSSTIFSAECLAISLAMDLALCSKEKRFLILSDSLSALQTLNNHNDTHFIVKKILRRYQKLLEQGKEVTLMWIPSHMGIKGNHKADEKAKGAIRCGNNFLKTCYKDFGQHSKQYVKRLWQEDWDKEAGNKLQKIIPCLDTHLTKCRKDRKEETVLARLHIGHGYLTHSHLWKQEEAPNCFAANCREQLTMEHILLKCQAMNNVRGKFYQADNMKVLFRDVPPDKIFKFLKEVNVFNQI